MTGSALSAANGSRSPRRHGRSSSRSVRRLTGPSIAIEARHPTPVGRQAAMSMRSGASRGRTWTVPVPRRGAWQVSAPGGLEARTSPRLPVAPPTCTGPGGSLSGHRRLPGGSLPPMQEILDAIKAGATGDDIANLPLPEAYRAAHVLRSEQDMWEGVESVDKDPRKSLHVGEVATAGAGARRGRHRRHGQLDQLQHRVDLDLRAAAHLRLPRPPGQGVGLGCAPRPGLPRGRLRLPRAWCCGSARRCATGSRATGSRCTATTSTTRTRRPTTTRCWRPTSASGASRPTTAAWPTCRSSRPTSSCPSPAHLSWEEAAVNALCASTSYRMLVGDHAGRMKQGDNVFVWGATGGIGAYAIQLVLNGGGIPVGWCLQPAAGEAARGDGLRGRHRPRGRGLPVLVRRAHPGRGRVAPPRQEGARA